MSEPWSSKVRISSYHLILSSWEVQDLNSSKCNPKNHHSVILDYNMEVYVFHQYFTGEIFSPVNSPVNRWCGEFFRFPILIWMPTRTPSTSDSTNPVAKTESALARLPRPLSFGVWFHSRVSIDWPRFALSLSTRILLTFDWGNLHIHLNLVASLALVN